MSTKLGPWTGMNNAKASNQVPDGQVMLAQDGCFSEAGHWLPRQLETLVQAGQAHSIWQAKDGRVFAVLNSNLVVLGAQGQTEASLRAVSGEVSFVDLPDYVLASDAGGTFRILANNTIQRLPPDAPAPLLVTTSGGGLPAGVYTVALAYTKRGEAGGLSSHAVIGVAADGAVICSVPGHPDADGYVLYRSTPDGDVLYLAASGDLDPWGETVTLQNDPLGELPLTQGMAALPALRCLALWHGQVLGARGRYLLFSTPQHYGLYDPVYDYIALPEYITGIYPVDDGVFIGTARQIYFAAGRDPTEWALRSAAHIGSCANALAVPAHLLPADLAAGIDKAGIFFTSVGHVVAMPDGSIRQPQAGILSLPVYSGGFSFVLDEHIVTIVKE